MNYTDREIEALAQWAKSPDPVNWELFNSQPLEERLRAFDLWFERWEDMEFENDIYMSEKRELSIVWIESTYCFLDLKISLCIGQATYFLAGIKNSSNRFYNSTQIHRHKDTDCYPFNLILADIYNTIKNHITNV